jgi:hypothetical protein
MTADTTTSSTSATGVCGATAGEARPNLARLRLITLRPNVLVAVLREV